MNLKNLTQQEIAGILKELGQPAFRAKQVFTWLHKGVRSYDEMSNLPKSFREKLKETADYRLPKIEQKYVSQIDGTVKYLFQLDDGETVESVLMNYKHGWSQCLSTQVGCKMGCTFCATGMGGFIRNLSAAEMIGQIEAAQQDTGVRVSSIVLMGMGEPLDNLEELLKALRILTESWGMAWSPRRITVSTIGYRPGLRRFIEETECHLALSLHAPYPEQRGEVMPVEKAFPIKELLATLREYDWSHQRRLSFEYIVFRDFNDSIKHADALVKLLGGIPCLVNLIRFHAIPGVDLKTSDMTQIEAFRDRLNERGVTATIRASRGEDIFAACGMLSTKKLKS